MHMQWNTFSELLVPTIQFLLEQKHLYQTVNIKDLACEYDKMYEKYDWNEVKGWYINFDAGREEVTASLPTTLSLVCANKECKNKKHPHNIGLTVVEPLGRMFDAGLHYQAKSLSSGYAPYFRLEHKGEVVQVFSLQYQCQACKGEPVTFLIRREGLKLQIVGRSRIEPCILPEGFPSKENSLFSDAVCASQTGSILAAICLLRIAIEQLVRRVAGDQDGRDIEGIFEEYKKTLPTEFPSNVKGVLKTAYDNLSVCMHSASANRKAFDEAMLLLARHFKMLSAFEFVNNGD